MARGFVPWYVVRARTALTGRALAPDGQLGALCGRNNTRWEGECAMSVQTLDGRSERSRELCSAEKTEELATKVCPQCGQMLFNDMAVCYGCLYDFTRAGVRRAPTLPEPLLRREVTVLGSEVSSEEAPADADAGGTPRIITQSRARDPELAILVQTGDVDLVVPLPPRGLMVGRLASNDIVLHSRAVSKRHVFLVPNGWTAIVQDQGATNPAILKGEEIVGGKTMCLGDTLNVCGSLLTLVEAKQAPSNAS